MKDNILLSFIMPCYNAAKYIKTCIETIINECEKAEFYSFEIIAVNDGSTDDTKDILDGLMIRKEYRLNVINQQNSGVSAARNIGIAQAKGCWIWFVDADDVISADSVCTLKERIFGGTTETDCIIFGFRTIDGNSITERMPLVPAGKITNSDITVDNSVLDELYIKNISGYSQKNINRLYNGMPISEHEIFLLGTVWHYLFRRDVIDCNKLCFDEKVSLNEDGLFTVDYLSCITKATIINNTCYDYRLNSTGGLFGTLNNPKKMTMNKIAIANGRERLRKKILERSGKDIRPYYLGSIVLSAMEIAAKSTKGKLDMELMKLYLSYCSSEVAKYSIKNISTKGAPLKYKIPFVMLKLGLHRTVFLIMWLIQKSGYQITGKNSLFK